jgi:glucose/arabinose dehydrogenase
MKRATALATGLLAYSSLLAFSCSAQAQTFRSSAGNLRVETVAGGLVHPWALAFLPDGRMLVTERPGRMRIATPDGKLSPALSGVPEVYASGQAGLLDVALDRDVSSNRTIYFCFNYESGGNAAIARARLADGEAPRLDDVNIIFRAQGPGGGNNHG